MRGLVIAMVLGACGRIGFDSRTGSGAGSGGDARDIDAIVVTGDGSVAGCGYVVCAMGNVACCANESTACVASGSCGGIAFQCSSSSGDGCTKTEQCCIAADSSSFCQPLSSACPGQ